MSVSNENSIIIDIHQSPKLDHTEDETKLVRYTDEHFINKLNMDLDKIRRLQVQRTINKLNTFENNSPILLSNENSDNEDSISQEDCHKENLLTSSYKRVTFRDIERSLNQYYESNDKYSNELDILTTYLRGQKNIFLKSQYITQVKLHLLMVPSLIGTAIITVFAPIIQGYYWAGAFISALNTVVAICMSIIYYLRLESLTTSYIQLSSQYDRMENSLEFTGNRLTFIKEKDDRGSYVLQKMTDIENKMVDIKDNITVILPNEIKRIFPIICHLNIFSFIKRIEVNKKNLMMKMKDIKNEIGYIEFKWGSQLDEKQTTRLQHLYQIKCKIKDEILHYKNAYSSIDELFSKEIQNADQLSIWAIWFSTVKKNTSSNPVLNEYLGSIFISD